MNIPSTEELFDLRHTVAEELMHGSKSPIELIPKIKEFCYTLGKRLGEAYEEISPSVWAARDAKISDGTAIFGPCIIGSGTEIRHGAYIRGAAIIGNGAVVGNSTEIKNSIIFDGAQLPHYNYVGDSIVGYRAHLGAGAVISNFRLDHGNITVRSGDERLDTGMRKFGALVGDSAEIGCNSVICPGSIIGKGCVIYPLSRFAGILEENYCFYGDGRAPRSRG